MLNLKKILHEILILYQENINGKEIIGGHLRNFSRDFGSSHLFAIYFFIYRNVKDL